MNNITAPKLIKQCEHFAEYHEEAAPVLNKITSKLTPEEFDALCTSNMKYEFNHSATLNDKGPFTALDLATEMNNIPLIRHIVKKGGKDLLNLGNDNGQTPLVSSLTTSFFKETTSDTAKELIRLNANVNMISKHNLTPLWLAVSQPILKMDVVKLLLKCGALIVHPFPIGDNRQKMIDQAQEQIKKDTEQCLELFLICRKDDSIPKEVIKKILKVIKRINKKSGNEVVTK